MWQILGLKRGQCAKLQALLLRLTEEKAVENAWSALQQAFTDFWKFMWDMVVDLFDSVRNFLRGMFGSSSPDDEPICSNIRAQRKWLLSQPGIGACQKARASVRHMATPKKCSEMRKCMRKVLLLVHPDKFGTFHPQCPPESSKRLAQEEGAAYTELKEKCGSR